MEGNAREFDESATWKRLGDAGRQSEIRFERSERVVSHDIILHGRYMQDYSLFIFPNG